MSTTNMLLEYNYSEPDRPYSQRELQFNREKLFRRFRIGKFRAHHMKCNHFYFVKENGRKQKDMEEKKSSDAGNCSVCWKLYKTPRHLKDKAENLINEYCDVFYEPLSYVSYENAELEKFLYRWLYEELK